MKVLAIMACALLLGACATLPDAELHEQLAGEVAARTGQSLVRSGDPSAEALIEELLSQPLGRDEALRVALAANRQYQAEFAALGIAAADFHDALALPNPVLDIEAMWPRDGGGPAWEFGLTQSVMALLTRPARRAIAESTLQASQQAALERVLAMMRDTEQVWAQAVADAETAALLAQAAEVTEAGQVAARALYDVGNIPRIELARERNLHEQTRLRAARAEAQAVASREALVRSLGLWGSQAQILLPDTLPMPEPAIQAPDELESEALASSLKLARLEASVLAAARDARVVEGTSLLPHLEFGVKAERERSGEWEQGASIEFELPVFDQGRGRRARSQALLETLRHQWWQSAIELRSHSRSAVFQYQAASEQAAHARQVILPLAAELLDLTVREWNAMNVGPFELLDARRSQLDAALHDVEARRTLWLAQLQLEHLRRGGAADAVHPSAELATGPARDRGH
ncbi:MAG: TolC family protein [Gammaproteobacteria bacterium]|nr:TolC family protein [Gammaproteobacteria bacterium]